LTHCVGKSPGNPPISPLPFTFAPGHTGCCCVYKMNSNSNTACTQTIWIRQKVCPYELGKHREWFDDTMDRCFPAGTSPWKSAIDHLSIRGFHHAVGLNIDTHLPHHHLSKRDSHTSHQLFCSPDMPSQKKEKKRKKKYGPEDARDQYRASPPVHRPWSHLYW